MDEDRIRIKSTEILTKESDKLKKTTFALQAHDGTWMEQQRETYQRDDGVTILLYNRKQRTVLLTRQFRLPVHLHGASGYMVETVAGMLEDEDPAARIKKEIREEVGYEVDEVQPLGTAYMSPAAVIEKVWFFAAEYDPARKVGPGGGLKEEGEDVEVLELDFDKAYAMLERGEITDGKTLILLHYAKLRIFPPKSMVVLVLAPSYAAATAEACVQPLSDAGHVAVLADWLMKPLARLTGQAPAPERLLACCDAVLRTGAASTSADDVVAAAQRLGKPVYHALDEIPALPGKP